MNREIVYYNEIHTMMYQEVHVGIHEKMLKAMLEETLTDESKRELIQTYYLCKLDQGIEIKPKTYYGAWNAAINNIKHIYLYEAAILRKLEYQVTNTDLQKNINLINENVLGLSEEENFNSITVQKTLFNSLGLVP